MPSRRIIAVALGLLVGCNALTGASDLAFDLDGGSAPVDASAPAPPPPSPIDAGIDDARGDASDASDGFVPFDGSDASNVKIVFVTSQSFVGGSLGGVAGGDSACATAAAKGGLAGTFVAWLSPDGTTSAAAARVTSAGPWFLPDGELALDRTQLVAVRGNIDHPIDVDELVQSVSGTAWTGTGNDLFNDSTCGVWTDSTMSGETGNVTGAGSGWSARSKVSCTAAYHLYCFEN